MPDTTEDPAWWGRFVIPDEQIGQWRVGPRTVWIQNFRYEWRVTNALSRDAESSEVSVTIPFAGAIPPAGEDIEVRRFGFRHDGGELLVEPRLADRPVVARPDIPFFVPGGEQVTIYVSTMLWMRFSMAQPPCELLEMPIVRPPDTWFGPSTREGELCYASRSKARLSLEDQPRRPERAITAVILSNRGAKALLIERLNLPVPYLALYRDTRGLLWTPPLTVSAQPAGANAEIKIGDGPPEQAQGATWLQGPRIQDDKNLLVRAMGLLLG